MGEGDALVLLAPVGFSSFHNFFFFTQNKFEGGGGGEGRGGVLP